MLNIWLNMKTNCSIKKIKKIGECHATAYGFLPESILIRSYLYVPVEFWYTCFTRKVNMTKHSLFLPQIYTMYAVAWHYPIFILFLAHLFLIFNQMLSIGSFGRRVKIRAQYWVLANDCQGELCSLGSNLIIFPFNYFSVSWSKCQYLPKLLTHYRYLWCVIFLLPSLGSGWQL